MQRVIGHQTQRLAAAGAGIHYAELRINRPGGFHNRIPRRVHAHLILESPRIQIHPAGLQIPTAVVHLAGLLSGAKPNLCWFQRLDGLNERLAQAFTTRFFISNARGRSVAALWRTMRVGAGNQHVLRFPAGHLGYVRLGFITHFTAHTDGVHHGNYRAPLAVFKS